MRRSRKICTLILTAALVASCCAGCGQESTELPDLSALGEITVITREEGSGTRSEFDSLVDTEEEGANQIALSTDEVLELVEEDTNAIGYLALSSLGDTDSVTVLSVDGVEPTSKTISNGKYPLCRQYMLAYSGELSELESDFITYVQGAGQAIVEDYCTPIGDAVTFLSNEEEGTITISGSSSVAPLIEELAEDYYTYNPNAVIEITVSDSTEGLNEAMRGECDLAMSSRSLESYEEELLEYEVIAVDGIAVVVNAESPLTDISMDLLQTIYDGDETQWSELEE